LVGTPADFGHFRPPYPLRVNHLLRKNSAAAGRIGEVRLELRHSSLYNGSLDGVIGPQTKQALVRFQKDNGLDQTATLDALTMVAMFGNIGTSKGSSMPPNAGEGTGQ